MDSKVVSIDSKSSPYYFSSIFLHNFLTNYSKKLILLIYELMVLINTIIPIFQIQ